MNLTVQNFADERTIREAAEDAGGLFEKSASEASSDEFQQIDSLRKEATSMRQTVITFLLERFAVVF